MSSIFVLSIGAVAQLFFSVRVIVQWVMSERARKVLSPSLFWVFSVAGAYLLCLYGWLRHDFAIILGQFISYYVYLWNLKKKGVWVGMGKWLRALLVLTPPVALAFVAEHVAGFVHDFFDNGDIPAWLIAFGSFGQVLFTLRFVYQFAYSRRMGESVLPAGFWIISLAGASTITAYGILRADPVLIAGQSFGIVAYSRNLWIYYHAKTCKA